jgi:hypothetical protein
MTKIVINACHGGFGLSKEAVDIYCARKGMNPGVWNNTWKYYEDFFQGQIDRADPLLIEVVETLGTNANGECANLRIVEIPDGVEWTICEYDGSEWVAEAHRTWS